MNNFETRTRNLKLFLAIALIGFFLTFIYPLLTDFSDEDFSIFNIMDIVYAIRDLMLIMLLGTILWIVSFILASKQFAEDEFERSDCRSAGLWMIPISLILFVFYMAMDSSGNIFQDLIKGYFEITKEYGGVIALAFIAITYGTIGYRLRSISSTKGLNIAGIGLYGMASVIVIALIIGIVIANANPFEIFKDIKPFLELSKWIAILSLITVVVGFVISLFSPIKSLGSEKPDDNWSETMETNVNNWDAPAPSAKSGVELSRNTPPHPQPDHDVNTPLNDTPTAYTDNGNYGTMVGGNNTDTDTDAKIRAIRGLTDRQLLEIAQQPELHSYAELNAATEILYSRRSPLYINGFRVLRDDQLYAILSDPTSYLPADVKAAAEEKRNRYTRT